jgi:hypothetical protein
MRLLSLTARQIGVHKGNTMNIWGIHVFINESITLSCRFLHVLRHNNHRQALNLVTSPSAAMMIA